MWQGRERKATDEASGGKRAFPLPTFPQQTRAAIVSINRGPPIPYAAPSLLPSLLLWEAVGGGEAECGSDQRLSLTSQLPFLDTDGGSG